MKSLLRFFSGWMRLTLPKEIDPAPFCDLLLREDLFYFGMHFQGDGSLSVCLPRRECRRLAACPEAKELPLLVSEEHGLPAILRRYRYRYGVLVGAFLVGLLLFFGGRFVWQVDVVGNTTLSADSVRETLKAVGCGVGSYIPGMDCYALTDAFLAADDKIAWASVNVKGTVVEVVLREREPEVPKKDTSPANLVAREPGVIVYTAVSDGDLAVHVGDPVGEGALLVSGFREDAEGKLTLVRAEGSVFARVVRRITVEIPDTVEEEYARETVGSEKTLSFFGKRIKFSKNTGNLPAVYDTIESKRALWWFGGLQLPISLHTLRYTVPQVQSVKRSEESLALEAKEMLANELAKLQAEGTVEKQVLLTEERAESCYRIVCEVTMITDIASQEPIEIH